MELVYEGAIKTQINTNAQRTCKLEQPERYNKCKQLILLVPQNVLQKVEGLITH
jgi:hypothetical protein